LKNAQNSHLLATLFENETLDAAFQRRLQAGRLRSSLFSYVELTLNKHRGRLKARARIFNKPQRKLNTLAGLLNKPASVLSFPVSLFN
jgi:hypothetical protein